METSRDYFLQNESNLQEKFKAIETAITFNEKVIAAMKFCAFVFISALEHVLRAEAKAPTEWPLCPKCGKKLQSKGFAPRQIMTPFGVIHWERRTGRCPNGCQIGQIAPYDGTLQIEPYQATCLTVKQLVCSLAVFLPFETAAFLLHNYFGLAVSASSIWNWVQNAGSKAMAQLNQELQQLQEGQKPLPELLLEEVQRMILLIGSDGVMVPFRPVPETPAGKTQWQEVKVGILARLTERVNREGKKVAQLVHKRVIAVLGSADDVKARLSLESERQGISQAPQVVWISDGARWLWNIYTAVFSEYAIGILDFYHAAQNLWKGTACWFDGRTSLAHKWFAYARRALKQGQCCEVIASLKQAGQVASLSKSVKDTLRQVAAYLETHESHMAYQRFKEMGLPIGSGFVESTCKWLIQQRFKGVGMRWSVDGFNHLLHLRLAFVNERFDDLFSKHASPDR